MPQCSAHRLPSVHLSGHFQRIELKRYYVAYASHSEALDRPSLPRVALSSARHAPLPVLHSPPLSAFLGCGHPGLARHLPPSVVLRVSSQGGLQRTELIIISSSSFDAGPPISRPAVMGRVCARLRVRNKVPTACPLQGDLAPQPPQPRSARLHNTMSADRRRLPEHVQ